MKGEEGDLTEEQATSQVGVYMAGLKSLEHAEFPANPGEQATHRKSKQDLYPNPTTAPFMPASKTSAAMLVQGRRYVLLTTVLTWGDIGALVGAHGIDELPGQPVTLDIDDSDPGTCSLLTGPSVMK